MRTSIFTDAERRAMKDYLNGEVVNPNFWGVLIHRIKKHNPSINADVNLMTKVLISVLKRSNPMDSVDDKP